MTRLLVVIAATVLAGASCSKSSQDEKRGAAVHGAEAKRTVKPAPAPPKPTSVLAQVQQWAPAGTRVESAGITVPGVELFTLTDGKPVADDEIAPFKLVGVAGGVGGKILEGRDLVRAAIEGKPDRRRSRRSRCGSPRTTARSSARPRRASSARRRWRRRRSRATC
jgi:hypothetical protein